MSRAAAAGTSSTGIGSRTTGACGSGSRLAAPALTGSSTRARRSTSRSRARCQALAQPGGRLSAAVASKRTAYGPGGCWSRAAVVVE